MMDAMRADLLDHIGLIAFILYIVISVIQAAFKKSPPDGENADDAPEPLGWDEEVYYDAQGRPVPGSRKESEPSPAAPQPVPAPVRRDPYGIHRERREENPREKTGVPPREAESRPVNIPSPARPSEHSRDQSETRETTGRDWNAALRELEGRVRKLDRQRAEAAARKPAAPARSGRGGPAAPPPSVPASPAIAATAMLKNPRTAAAAFVISEIIGPPVARRRWKFPAR